MAKMAPRAVAMIINGNNTRKPVNAYSMVSKLRTFAYEYKIGNAIINIAQELYKMMSIYLLVKSTTDETGVLNRYSVSDDR